MTSDDLSTARKLENNLSSYFPRIGAGNGGVATIKQSNVRIATGGGFQHMLAVISVLRPASDKNTTGIGEIGPFVTRHFLSVLKLNSEKEEI
ncbi:MAG: hypothetical protein CMK92_05155 [Pseudomonas sp.]|nr:hypothetical protein [Pseudomonas sp.]